MAQRQLGNLFTAASEKRVKANIEGGGPLPPLTTTISNRAGEPPPVRRRYRLAKLLDLLGLTSMAILAAVGITSHSSSSRFGPISPLANVIPVALAPGRLRLA